jgi:hypothetical protein
MIYKQRFQNDFTASTKFDIQKVMKFNYSIAEKWYDDTTNVVNTKTNNSKLQVFNRHNHR